MAWQQGGDLYGQVVNSAGAAQGGDRPLVTHEGNQQEAALATGHSAGYGLLAWRDNRSGNDDIYSRLITPPLQTTRISYSYDPLYRLRTAIYTGAITATYHYVYDGVGNMTAYTEQVDNQTTAVSRSFNAANQLVSSNDGSETVDYAYDANGNLVTIDHWLMSVQTTYAYDQRNLLTSQTNWRIGEPDLQAAFVYDGDGYRVQMIDYTGLPRTITYSNDILGLTQVLLADDGATTTANLLGLDLIAQDDGSETRVLLADGLGSARVEMVGGVVETTTTYEPYGKLLAQTGSSGATYGFTGEQEDAATGLVYLRARYYSPYLNQFQSRDSFSGYPARPASQNGYNYVNGNPVNFTDPSGHDAWWCDAQDYSGVPSYAVNDAIQNCQAQYNRSLRQQWGQQHLPSLLGSNAPYLVYESKNGYTGRLVFYNSPVGTISWNARSGALPGEANPENIPALGNEYSYRGVPYITNSGFFSQPEGQRYPAGEACYFGQCYAYPSGTFPVDWPKLSEWQYDNDARLVSQWNVNVWGRYRIPLDAQPSPSIPFLGGDSPSSIGSGVFIHAGNPDNPTYGCVRLTQEGAVDELVGYLKQLNEPLRLFIMTPPLPNRPVAGNTWWYYPFSATVNGLYYENGYDYTIINGTRTGRIR